MRDAQEREVARGMPVPVNPESPSSPRLTWGAGALGDLVSYVTSANEHVRVTFDRLDAIKICRGEYLPFPAGEPIQFDDSSGSGYSGLYIIENSRWLRERYAYESRYYQNWTVDEMLTEHDHYLLASHDEFIEAIAAGIWFERSEQQLASDVVPSDHPLVPLPESTVSERFVVDDITCQVRSNPKPIEEILWGARYCAQPLFDFHLELGGPSPRLVSLIWHRLVARERRQEVRSTLRHHGQPIATWPGIPTLSEAKSLLEPEIRAVRERRREMGL
jgi:hypothetical protein